MRILLVGATGVLGRSLVPLLLSRGHQVRALARQPSRVPAGAEAVQGDLLDPALDLVELSRGCDAAIHGATAIPRDPSAPGAWELNSRLRIEGTRRLVEAAQAAGVRRYVQQSIEMAYAGGGDQELDEAAPFDSSPSRAAVVEPVRSMEATVRASALDWVILRCGLFVGPGTGQDALVERLRAGTEVIPGTGRGWFSPIHVADAAMAFAVALASAPARSVLNANAQPLRLGAYYEALAEAVGAEAPRADASRPDPSSYRCAAHRLRGLGWLPAHPVIPARAADILAE
jgi:nucleoside-diphosphate-sugar epimerase